MPEAKAFLEFNFAPPTFRRNIGVLGLLHKRGLGKTHPVYQQLLPFRRDAVGSLHPNGHDKQLYGQWLDITFQAHLHANSIFGMVDIYNLLPQDVVDCQSVSLFQRQLTFMVRDRCRGGATDWHLTFDCRHRNF